jgi:hypothetical protein
MIVIWVAFAAQPAAASAATQPIAASILELLSIGHSPPKVGGERRKQIENDVVT